MKSAFLGLGLLAVAASASADTFIGDRNEAEVIFGVTSDKTLTGQVHFNEVVTHAFGLMGLSDMAVSYSDIEYLSLNVRIVLARANWTSSDVAGESRDGDFKVFLVMPFLGDVRFKPGYNDMGAGPVGENLSVDASYGGLGVQLVQDITKHVRVAGRLAISHHRSAEMLPPGTFTVEGAKIMDRRDGIFLNTNLIDADGAKAELTVQAEVLRKLLISLRGAASRLAQNSARYQDLEAQVHAKYNIYQAPESRFRFNVYGDYYLRVTNLTDLGHDRTFQLLSGGVSVNW